MPAKQAFSSSLYHYFNSVPLYVSHVSHNTKKKLTLSIQQRLLIIVVTYASVMKKITSGSPLTPGGMQGSAGSNQNLVEIPSYAPR